MRNSVYLIFIQGFFDKLSGRFPNISFESIAEIGLGRETTFICNLCQGHIGVNKQINRLFDSLIFNIFP